MFGCKFWCKYKWNAVCNLFVSVFMWNRSLTQILRIQFTYWKLTWNKSLLTPQLHNLDLFAWSLQRLMMRIRRNMAWLSSSHSIFMQKYHFPIKTNISRFSIYHFFTLSRDSFVRIPKSPPQHNLLLSSGNFRMFPAKLENYKTIFFISTRVKSVDQRSEEEAKTFRMTDFYLKIFGLSSNI